MGRRNDHSPAELRRLFLDAARKLVTSGGRGALTARALAGAIGYTPGSLYLVFENLDELILRLNGTTLDRLWRSMTRQTDPRAEAADNLRRMAQAYARFARRHPNLWQLVFDHRLPEGQPVPADFQAKVSRLVTQLHQEIRRLQPAAPDRAVQLRAQTLFSAVHGCCSLALSGKLDVTGGAGLTRVVDSCVDSLLATD